MVIWIFLGFGSIEKVKNHCIRLMLYASLASNRWYTLRSKKEDADDRNKLGRRICVTDHSSRRDSFMSERVKSRYSPL